MNTKAKKLLAGLFMIVLIVMCLSLSASAELFPGDNVSSDKNYSYRFTSYTVDDKQCDGIVVSGTNLEIEGDYTVPETIDGYTVLGIGTSAFRNQKKMTSFRMPSTVKFIEMQIVSGCPNLQEIVLHEELESVGSFETVTVQKIVINCNIEDLSFIVNHATSIEHVEISENNEYYKSIDGVMYTKDMKKLVLYPSLKKDKEYIMPEGVEEIGKYAIYENYKIESIILADSLKKVGDNSVAACLNLKKIVMGNNVEEIGNESFSSNVSLKEINLSKKLKTVGDAAFMALMDIKSLTLPATLETIGDSSFLAATSLEEIIVENGNKNYVVDEYGVLYNADKTTLLLMPAASKLTQYTIPETVTSINGYSLFGVKNLKSITIPDNCLITEDIGLGAFYELNLTFSENGEISGGYVGQTIPVTVYGTKGSSAEVYVTENDGAEFFTDLYYDLTFEDLATHIHSCTQTVITAPSCTVKGLSEYNCACGYSYTADTPEKGHTAPNENGNCSVCGEKLVQDEEEKEKSFFEKIAEFFKSIIDFFKNLFGVK